MSVAEASPAPDRAVPAGRLVPVFLACTVSMTLAAGAVPSRAGATLPAILVGGLVSAMAIFLLRSIPPAWAGRGIVLLGAALMARYGQLGDAGLTSPRVIGWGVATVAVFVLSSRLEIAAPRRGPRRAGRTVATIAALGALVAAGTLSLGPSIADSLSTATASGDRADASSRTRSNPLVAAQRVDISNRPQLSDEVVMTVRSPRPSFWRTSTMDRWDGRSWTRAAEGVVTLLGGRVRTQVDDLAAQQGEVLVQRIRIESKYAESLPAAPSAVSVDAPRLVGQWSDGSIVSVGGPLGAGATFTVTSRQIAATPELLRAAEQSGVPESVLAAYADRPVASERVRRLAARLTDGEPTTYDKILAIERYLGETTEYSLDAPVSPDTDDVVDDFVFESKVGWCEQIASTLAVMLREVGVPARVATGFVAGEWDPIAREYRVRERDAHMWTEVWFAGLGWVPFDPTADVPFAGSQPAGGTVASWWADHAAGVLLAIGLAALLAEPLLRLVGRLRRRGRRSARRGGGPAPLESPSWARASQRRLERLGARAGRSREANETLARYAAALGAELGPAATEVGTLLDEVLYGPLPATDGTRERVEGLLDQLERQPARVS